MLLPSIAVVLGFPAARLPDTTPTIEQPQSINPEIADTRRDAYAPTVRRIQINAGGSRSVHGRCDHAAGQRGGKQKGQADEFAFHEFLLRAVDVPKKNNGCSRIRLTAFYSLLQIATTSYKAERQTYHALRAASVELG